MSKEVGAGGFDIFLDSDHLLYILLLFINLYTFLKFDWI